MEDLIERLKSGDCDAEEILEITESLLKLEDVPESGWGVACRALVVAGRATWWRCDCGEIKPDLGNVDAFCMKCGQMRRLPNRLSRSPWGLYVRCLKRCRPECWFRDLSEWMMSEGLGHEDVFEGVVLPEAIDAGGSRVLPEAKAAWGAVPTENKKQRKIICIDGMIIEESGEVRGLQWISLPMMMVNE